MKKKVRVKSLPKAQNGMQPPMVLTPEQKNVWLKNQGMFGSPTAFQNPFELSNPSFIYNTKRPATSGEFVKSPGMGPIGADDYYANVAQQNIAAPAGTRFDKDFGYAPGTAMPSDLIKKPNQKGNPYVGQAILAGTDIFRGLANQIDNRFAKRDLRDQFLSDNLAYAREEGQSGNRGDYNFNEFGFGPSFRPDDYIKGDYNKIAQMGGEMKRKVKITSLPQAGYGGSQNQNAVNQLYGNSAYMVNKFSGAEQEEQEPAYNQTLQPDPRSMAVLEAEKGETLIRKGTNSAIPEFFKIGGKRHSEGGTPLSGEKATPDSFIYSDTKAMKIKDPAILESFGFAAKKGGYTPAKISKKFDLNSKELREGLYSDSDPLRKKTAVMMADNYISNLGKLALVQESQKGFPQGVPQIAMPYMNKVGLDPAQFLPPSPEQGMMMAMYGGIPKAQIGQSVNPGGMSNVSIDNLPQYEIDWLKFRQRATDPNQPLPSTQEYMAAQRAYNKSKWDNSSMINPLNWGPGLNYGLTGQFENMGDSYSKYNGEGPMTTAIRYGTDPVFMGLAANNYGRLAETAGAIGEFALPGVRNFLQKASLPNILEAGTLALKDVATGIKNVPANLTALANTALPYANITLPYIQKLASPAALGLLIYSHSNDEPLTTEQEIALLKRLDTTEVNTLMESPAASKISSDSLIEASRENPNIDVAKIEPVTIKAKPKVNVPKPSTGFTAPDGSIIEFEYGGESSYQTGGEKGTFLAKHTDASGKEYSSYLQGDKVVLVYNNEVVSTRPATEKDRPAISTYDKEAEDILRKIKPDIILNKDYVEGMQRGADAKIPGTYGRFEKDAADKNWSWYGKPINWTNKPELKQVQKAYNKEMYNRFINADYTPEEAAKYVKLIGFDESKEEGQTANDGKPGKWTETRVVFDVPKKPGKPGKPNTPRDPLEPGELNPPPIPRRPIGFYPQDVLNTAAAVGDLASINKYNPRMAQFVPEPMEPTFYDPNRELANNAELANIASANLAQFTGPQAFNTRFSDVQGKSLANAANVLGRYNNLNVGVANQFEQANKQINNEANFRNALMANDFYDKTVIANQQFDNSKRAARREAVDYVNAALENRFMTDQMNSLYPNFFVDPAALKTYYNPGRKITPGQQAKDLKQYFLEMGIDTTNPTVQAAMVRGIMGDIDIDERGNILGAQSAMSNRRKTKGS